MKVYLATVHRESYSECNVRLTSSQIELFDTLDGALDFITESEGDRRVFSTSVEPKTVHGDTSYRLKQGLA